MCNEIIESAEGFGADMLITACPLCMYNLKKSTVNGDLPVYYFTELLAEALGVKEEVTEACSDKTQSGSRSVKSAASNPL